MLLTISLKEKIVFFKYRFGHIPEKIIALRAWQWVHNYYATGNLNQSFSL